jgi:uncharacterized repeat protein (TIGR01451 family)
MRMRRVYITVFIGLFCLVSLLPGTALAQDDGVTVSSVMVSPASLPGDGQVTVTATVSVSSGREGGGITDVRIGGEGVSSGAPVDSIAAGSAQAVSCLLNVAAGQLGQPIQLAVEWKDETTGTPGHTPFPSPIVVASSENQVSFTRAVSPDKPSVLKGETVRLTYTVRNEGTADVSELAVTDGGIPGMQQAQASLPAGETATFTCDCAMNAEMVSTPKLTYRINGEPYTVECTPRTVSVRILQLNAVLSSIPASVSSGGAVLLNCSIENSGNVKLTNIAVADSAGNKLYSLDSLDRNESHAFSRMLLLTQSAHFQFTISARDDSGDTASFKTNELEVSVTSSGGRPDATIQADPDALQLAESGEVGFDIRISNNGPGPLLNAHVEDQGGNTVRAFPSLLPGETEFIYRASIDATTQFNFSLVVPGEQGDFRVETGPIEIKLASDAPSGSAVPLPSPSGGSADVSGPARTGGLDWLVNVLLIIGALILVTIGVMVVLTVRDRKRDAKRKDRR